MSRNPLISSCDKVLADLPRGAKRLRLSFILYIVGINHTAPAVASIVAMVEPVTASLFGVAVLNQELIGSQVFGMVLILATVTALSLWSSVQQARAEASTR